MDAKTEPFLDELTLMAWLSVDPDAYLDARRPGWEAHERAGLVRHAHLRGQRCARVYVAPAATEVFDELARAAEPATPADRRASRPIGSLG